MIIIETKRLPKNWVGITIWPFIFLNYERVRWMGPERYDALVNHERIHLRQQLELLVIPFYLLYCLNFLVNMCRYFFPAIAYREIIFEREAKGNEDNPLYLRKRKRYAFLNYFKKQKQPKWGS